MAINVPPNTTTAPRPQSDTNTMGSREALQVNNLARGMEPVNKDYSYDLDIFAPEITENKNFVDTSAVEDSPVIKSFYNANRAPGNYAAKVRMYQEKYGLDSAEEKNKLKQQNRAAFTKEMQDAATGAGFVDNPVIRPLAGGVIDAASGAVNTLIDLADHTTNMFGADFIADQDRWDTSDILQPKSTPEAIARRITKVASATAAIAGTLTAAGVSTGGMGLVAIGAAADFLTTDPTDKLISELIQDTNLQNPVTEFFAAADSNLEKRAVAAIEGSLIGYGLQKFVPVFMKTIKALKGVKTFKSSYNKYSKALITPAAEEGAEVAEQVVKSTPPSIPEGAKKAGKMLSRKPREAVDELDAILSKEGVPLSDVRINMDNIETTEDVAKLIAGIDKAEKASIDEARRGVITNVVTEQLAKDLDLTMEQMLLRSEGQAWNAEQLLRAREYLVGTANLVVEKAQLYKTATMEEKDKLAVEMMDSYKVYKELHKQISGATAEAGRALQAMNIKVSGYNVADSLGNLVDYLGGHQSMEKFADAVAEGISPAELSKISNQTSLGQKLNDALLEVRVSSLLGNIPTQGRNIFGNATQFLGGNMERGLRALYASNKYAMELQAQREAMNGMFTDAFKIAKNSLKTGVSNFDSMTKTEVRESALDNLFGGSMKFLSTFINLPNRAMTSADDFFKYINYRQELYSLAYRDALENQVDDVAAHVATILEKPPRHIQSGAIDFAREMTFTAKLGEYNASLYRATTGIPVVGRHLFPFMRTGLNMMRYVAERTPGMGIAMKRATDPWEVTMAKQTTGFMAVVGGGILYSSGVITGARPSNREAARIWDAAGMQEYSIKIGDSYYRYDDIHPVGKLIGLTANMMYALDNTQNDEEDSNEKLSTLAVMLGDAYKPEFVFDTIGSLLEIVESGDVRRLDDFFARMGASYVPYSSMQRKIARGLDPIQRQTSPNPYSEFAPLDTFVNTVRAQTPGLSEELPPRINIITGEPQLGSHGFWAEFLSPISTRRESQSPVAREMVRLGLTDDALYSRQVMGNTQLRIPRMTGHMQMNNIPLKLNWEQQSYLERAFYKDEDGVTFEQLVKDNLLNNDGYKEASDEIKKSMMMKLYRMRIKQAEGATMNKFPELQTQLMMNAKIISGELLGQ